MTDRTLTQTKTAVPTFAPVNSGVLQRSAVSNQPVNSVLPIARDALRSSRQALDPATRAFMAPRVGHDFSQIPVHTKTLAKLQTKLTVNTPGDIYEQEADAVADKVMRMAEPAPIGSAPAAVQRKCATCDDEAKNPIQTKPTSSAHADAGLDAGAAVSAAGQGGAPLSRDVRSYFEPRFGHDFSGVRVHADGDAANAARAVQARAYTFGSDIVFGSGEYAPATVQGKRLIAHELVHVVQQGTGTAASTPGVLAVQSHDRQDADEGLAEKNCRLTHIGASVQQGQTQSHRALKNTENGADAANNVLSGNGPISLSQAHPAMLQRVPAHPGTTVGPHHGSTLPYREATNLAECTRIMGSENLEYCRREVLGDDVSDAPFAVRAQRVSQDLADLIKDATWKEIRKRVYPKESAPGVRRARDRKAGLLPDLTGLGRISSLEHFAGAVRGVQHDWTALTPDKRVEKLGDAAKAEMSAADVPGFLIVDKKRMLFKGFFRRDFWSFTISESLVTGASLNDGDAAEVANTTLHESRHAEQQFLAARFSAGVNGKDAAGIHTEQDIPTTIAQKAVDKKFDSATDLKVAALGREMFAATVTHGTANQTISNDDGLADLAARKAEAETAIHNLTAGVTPQTYADANAKRNALRAQIIDVERRYTLYRNIPYEADAHEVGDAAEQAFKGWK